MDALDAETDKDQWYLDLRFWVGPAWFEPVTQILSSDSIQPQQYV